MRTVAIIQARMGSTRLPGKVLMDLEGKSVLARVIERLQRARRIDEILVATTDSSGDQAIVEECRRLSAPVFRGQEDDVLDRYYRAAQSVAADAVVRITSDCPLIDPEVTDRTVQEFVETDADYASNCLERHFPRGLDTEVLTRAALEQAWHEADQPHQRAHVTPYIYEHPEKFRLASYQADADYSQHRWTVDTAEDLQLIRAIYDRMRGRRDFLWRDVLEAVEREPELIELNRGVEQKALHLG